MQSLPQITRTFVLAVSLMLPVLAVAKDALNADDLRVADTLLEYIGLSAQVARSADTLAAETLAARQLCESSTLKPHAVAEFMRTLYAPEVLAAAARQKVHQGLSAAEKQELLDWIASPTGQKVYAAETALQTLDAEAIAAQEAALVKSSGWTEQRQRDIYRILRVTRVHHYVAALNTALTAAVNMASACETDFGSLNTIEITQRKEQTDEKLVAGLMLNSFIVPTGVVFESLSAEELKSYFLFSATETGKKWYALVIDTVRSVLTDPIPAVRKYIEQPATALTGSLED